MHPLRRIDDLLNHITMYRLVTYVLLLLLGIAWVFMLSDVLAYDPIGFMITTGVLLLFGFLANQGFARLFNIVPNHESGLITALILACIMPQTTLAQFGERVPLIALTVVLAIAVKYVLVWRGSHFLNPAAAGAVIVSVFGILPVTWWIANPSMFLPTLVLGLLIVRKVRRFELFGLYVLASVTVMIMVSALDGIVPHQAVGTLLLSYPLLFLGMVMLTEPTTMPAGRLNIAMYGALVGVLFASQIEISGVDMTPHLALIVGNMFSLAASPKRGLRLRLKERRDLAPNIHEFVFSSPGKTIVPYKAGQYMEWTVPGVAFDSRGNRRTFTIASSPTETDLRIGIKTYGRSSAYKRRLLELEPRDGLLAGHIGGNFTLPSDAEQKLLWVAGGIGVTPFRSMAKYLTDTGAKRDIVLLYVARPREFVYQDIFKAAEAHGLRTEYLTNGLDADMIKKFAPELDERIVYVSGPNGMVTGVTDTLADLGVNRAQIHTDLFTGY